jgi:hypothetical protein
LQEPPKFTQIWIFGLKTNHLATLLKSYLTRRNHFFFNPKTADPSKTEATDSEVFVRKDNHYYLRSLATLCKRKLIVLMRLDLMKRRIRCVANKGLSFSIRSTVT